MTRPRSELGRAGGIWTALPWSLRYAAVASGCGLLVAAFAYLLLRLAVMVAPLTLAIVAAVLLAALLQPVTDALVRRALPRTVGALVTVLVLLALLVGPGVLVWRVALAQLPGLPGQLAEGWERTRSWLTDGPWGISGAWLDAAASRAGESARGWFGEPAAFAVSAIEAIGAALLALVLLFFLLKDGPTMGAWLLRLAPARSRDRWAAAADAGWTALARYARGTVVVAAVDAIGIGLALALIGVPLALPLALLTFVAAFVPILGATVAGVLATLVALAANGPVDALLTLAAVIAVQQLEGNLLEPLIMGTALRLHPAVVLIAVTAGALTGGVAGALVAMPLTAVVYKMVRTLLENPAEAPG